MGFSIRDVWVTRAYTAKNTGMNIISFPINVLLYFKSSDFSPLTVFPSFQYNLCEEVLQIFIGIRHSLK